MSNWHTEMRSNRYNYATRFARHLPVLFVQPDKEKTPGNRFIDTTLFPNLEIIHVTQNYGIKQNNKINLVLNSKGFIKPLVWIYNFYFYDFIFTRYSPFTVFHATEDYYCEDFIKFEPREYEMLGAVLNKTNLLISVSKGVESSFLENSGYNGETLVLTNGCDYKFWSDFENISSKITQKKTAVYQGGIHSKIDFSLVEFLAENLVDWEFHFCGRVQNSAEEWKRIVSQHKNIKYHGQLPVEKVREIVHQATVGIIPFVQNEWIIEKSFPLKTFEYIAAGRPVVSVPIKSILPYKELINFASTKHEFLLAVKLAAEKANEPALIEKRKKAAAEQDYDIHFRNLINKINLLHDQPPQRNEKLNILILYDKYSTYVNTITDHLKSFYKFSFHNIYYSVPTRLSLCQYDLSNFDVIIIHYSVRLSLPNHISPEYSEELKNYGGLKVLFIQDEYDNTETTRRWIEDLGIQIVYTCVPEEYREKVYPSNRFEHVEFVHTLTGYVPPQFENENHITRKPLEKRQYKIGYRGRSLPYWYGNLGQEKIQIGKKIRSICEEKGIAVNIEWEDSKRIYGTAWYSFLEDCVATLGTESGSNVFDDHGDIRRNIEKALENNPNISYE